MFSAAGAFNISEGFGRQSRRGNMAKVKGYTLGGSGGIVLGESYDNGTGIALAGAGSSGLVDAQVWDAPGRPWDAVRADGSAETGNGTLVGLVDNGFAAGGTLAGAGFKAKARLIEGDGYLVTKVKARDWKFSVSGAIDETGDNGVWKVKRNGDIKLKLNGGHNGALTGGYALVGANAHAEGTYEGNGGYGGEGPPNEPQGGKCNNGFGNGPDCAPPGHVGNPNPHNWGQDD